MLTKARGVTLIELMVVVSIIALLMALAAPNMAQWSANSRLRTVAEEFQNGLRLAQAEAIRTNRQAAFVLTNTTPALTATPATNGSNWVARLLVNPLLPDDSADDTYFLRSGTSAKQHGITVVGPAVLCFNSIGRPVANSSNGLGANCTAPASIAAPTQYRFSSTQANIKLGVEVSLGGEVRMCDGSLTLSSTAPTGCRLTW
jgi:type IV fimbrial biogenesis protein FimT